MFHSAALQGMQDNHLAGQIAGRGIPLNPDLVPMGGPPVAATIAGNRQGMFNRPLPKAGTLPSTAYMGLALDNMSVVPAPNSLLFDMDGMGLAEYNVI